MRDVDGAPMRFGRAHARRCRRSGEEVTVVVGETTRKRDRLAEEILFYVWVPQFVLLMLAGWIAYRTIVAQTDKIHALSDVAARHQLPQAARRVPGHNMPAEMQPLIEALNAMIAKLDAAALAHRTFIANAAHQLRTPLTALNLQAEQAIHCGDVDDMRAGGRRACRTSVHRATRLANQLLLLSRAEPEAQSGANRTPHRPLRAGVRDRARVGAGGDGGVDRPRLRRRLRRTRSSRSTRRWSPRRSTTCSTTRSSTARRTRG